MSAATTQPINLIEGTPQQHKLFDFAYAHAHRAADELAQVFSTGKIDRERSRLIYSQLTAALCAWQEFDNLLAGNPEPKRVE
jgi:hypothetical protein